MSLDKKDKLILSLLQEDSTLSVKEISEKIGLTFTPTYERIKNLEKSGVVEKYVALLNREKLGINIVVYCNVRLKEQSQTTLKEFENYISKYDEVQEIISLSGEYDYQLKILANDIYSYNHFTVNVISNSPHIGQYHSSIVLAEVKNLPNLNWIKIYFYRKVAKLFNNKLLKVAKENLRFASFQLT